MSNTCIKRYLLRFSYIGSCYRGSQKHANSEVADIDSVQGAVEYSLRRLRIANVPNLILAGRTDAGVHALCMTAHMDLEHMWSSQPFDTSELVRKMNRFLINSNHEIRIFSIHEVSQDFHARFSAKSRTYLYRIIIPKDQSEHRVPITEAGRSMHVKFNKQEFDIERMREGIKLFSGTKDFMTFSAFSRDKTPRLRSYVKTLNVTMNEANPMMPLDPMSKNFDYWHLIFTSRSFLYNQIRRIVGALIALGAHKISEENIITMLQVPSHHNWDSRVAPAASHGLYLMNVEYDEEIMKIISNLRH